MRMHKIFFAALLLALILLCGCGETKKFEQTYYFVCGGKFYNFESAYSLSKTVKLRGGSGYIFENRAYFVFVSMHSSENNAKSVAATMPSGYFVHSLSLPDFSDEIVAEILEILNGFLKLDLYAVANNNYENLFTNLKSQLQNCQTRLKNSKYLYLKADFFVVCSLIDKVFEHKLDAEQNARLFQTQLFFDLYNFILQL